MAAGMKKVFQTALTDLKTTDVESVGTLRFEGNKVYKWVQFSGVTAVVAGTLVCYNTTVGANLGVTGVDGANSVVAAGIAQVAVGTGTVQYGWIQVAGPVAFQGTITGAAGAGLTANGATAGNLVVTSGVIPQFAILLDATNKILLLCGWY